MMLELDIKQVLATLGMDHAAFEKKKAFGANEDSITPMIPCP